LLGTNSEGTIVTSTASSNESFYYDGSDWVDLVSFDPSANFCIKALTGNKPVSLEPEIEKIPNKFGLEQNYPNPFNPSTTIHYQLAEPDHVKIIVYSALGEKVKVLVDGWHNFGTYSVTFDGSELPAGVYFYNLVSNKGTTQSKKMVLLK
jgi:hypothetical protein